MQLIDLAILDGDREVRSVVFKGGINIITNLEQTGNQIGKSTSLRALAFCLGGGHITLWQDPDNKKINTKVKEYLTKGDVKFVLRLKIAGVTHTITRVLSTKPTKSGETIKVVSTIDDAVYKANAAFARDLPRLFGYNREQPTFGSIRSKFFRISRPTSNNSIRYLSVYTSDNDYALIYAFLFDFDCLESIRQINFIEHESFVERERINTLLGTSRLEAYQSDLQQIDLKLATLEVQEDEYDLLESQNHAIADLRNSRHAVAVVSSRIAALETKLYYNQKTIERYRNNLAEVDAGEIAALYSEAKSLVPNLSKTLEETIDFHNSIMSRKAEYVEELSEETVSELGDLKESLEGLLSEEKRKVKDLSRDSQFSGFILIEKQMQELREARGRISYVLTEVEASHKRIADLQEAAEVARRSIEVKYSDLNAKLDVFNEVYSAITRKLFVKHDNELEVAIGDDGKPVFSITNEELNTGDGVPRAAAMAFDMAYVEYVKKQKTRLPAFTAQDYLESVDESKLAKLFDFANENNIQTIAAILSDKLDGFGEKFLEDNVVLYLRSDEKFFKV
ncbi:hypothetical protein ALQ08_01348 [Pseudomonas syringae pv. delphinii]|uniref:DUF2326 domain-containing protein n=1 Tax=Pseudomonas syringae pv. delphinii TaxID=192088 RepID=A0A0N8RGC9_9PSED|nr:DUF2326 domain-containing protein [Pseudomonas syringae group genomosp. 3]KPX25639.1 hypothetical protein ALO72_200196 [Pseudomonas syringae pv. delphinii]RMP26552.1 hypothetical protein ALQ27_00611 [Pseudomonas syringae pv. delphinii]RMQ22106.1 hypothetical protein ALQ08_01348 [Pseudomonas syringae pv. delphinii]